MKTSERLRRAINLRRRRNNRINIHTCFCVRYLKCIGCPLSTKPYIRYESQCLRWIVSDDPYDAESILSLAKSFKDAGD